MKQRKVKLDIREIENEYDLELALSQITPRQKEAVELYGYGLTQEEIGAELGISKMGACGLLKRGILSLRNVYKTTQ